MGAQPQESSGRLEQALARSTVYRLLSEVSLYPGWAGGAEQRQPDGRGERRVVLDDACEVLSRAGYTPAALGRIAELARAFLEAGADVPADEYVRIFGHTVSTRCPPYETEYGRPHIFGQTEALADLAGFYRAFGLEVRPGAGERPDHVGIELEFMHVLTYKEAYALEHHGAERADLCREAQRKFLRDHLGTWVQDFAPRLARCAGSGLYRLYAEALDCYVAAELAYLEVAPARHKSLEPHGQLPEPPSCGPICESSPGIEIRRESRR